MSDWEPGGEPTHMIPPDLEAKLIDAKDWYDRRVALEQAIQASPGIAERNQEDRDGIDREAAPILEEIVEIIENTWGYGRVPAGAEA